jgi:1-acyl-sn-glycerol-3-phosphate acyltransferase
MPAEKRLTGPMVGERKASVLGLTKTITRLVFFPFFRIKTGGRHNLPEETAFILLPKHQRWEDIPLLALATPRPLYYMAKNELFVNPLSGWLLSSLGGIPLNRARPLESRRSLKTMMSFLGKGEGIVVFPEGTYYRNAMGPGHVGLVRMVQTRFTLPFIPVGINYSEKRGRGQVRINFGSPISGDSYGRPGDLLARIMEEIARLSGLS